MKKYIFYLFSIILIFLSSCGNSIDLSERDVLYDKKGNIYVVTDNTHTIRNRLDVEKVSTSDSISIYIKNKYNKNKNNDN